MTSKKQIDVFQFSKCMFGYTMHPEAIHTGLFNGELLNR